MNEKLQKMSEVIEALKTKEMKLVSTYEEGYIGKKIYQVTLNDGSIRMCEQITKNKDSGNAVVIVPITVDGKFLMIIESRPNTKESIALEFPAGMVDKDEDFVVAAKRELLEETGYEADDVYELEWHYQDQGCSNAIITTYVALGCRKVQEQNLDADEKLVSMEMTYEEILELMKQEKSSILNDANTKTAFMSYLLKQKGVL